MPGGGGIFILQLVKHHGRKDFLHFMQTKEVPRSVFGCPPDILQSAASTSISLYLSLKCSTPRRCRIWRVEGLEGEGCPDIFRIWNGARHCSTAGDIRRFPSFPAMLSHVTEDMCVICFSTAWSLQPPYPACQTRGTPNPTAHAQTFNPYSQLQSQVTQLLLLQIQIHPALVSIWSSPLR
jgi:hypothetical protein